MDILFIHGNYPGQFRHLCAGFGANDRHNCVFLTARKDAERDKLNGVKTIIYEQHRKVSPETHHYVHATEEAVLQGQAVLRGLDSLLQEGFRPRLVIFHGGMGLGLFLRDVLPDAILIGYFEWWFTTDTTKYLVEKFDMNMQLSAGLRNLPTMQELEQCDAGVVPTEWQKQQFTESFKSKLHVIFDGIDTSFFHPQREENGEVLRLRNRETKELFEFGTDVPILSYATRGMEPLRGFPEFMRALPYAFSKIKDLQVVIAGKDRCAYSYPAPSHQGSWRKHLLNEISNNAPIENINFTGLLNYHDYRALLWRSDLHCYFTRPYVTSWSFFEATSCSARLLSNKSPATNNISEDNTVKWTDLDNQDEIERCMAIELKNSLNKKGKRAKIKPGFELGTNIRKWENLINSLMN